MLEHVKFSKIISGQLNKDYLTRLPDILKKALKRANVNKKMVQNFLIAITTGKLIDVSSKSLVHMSVTHYTCLILLSLKFKFLVIG